MYFFMILMIYKPWWRKIWTSVNKTQFWLEKIIDEEIEEYKNGLKQGRPLRLLPPYTQKQKRYALRTWKLRYVNLPTWMNGKKHVENLTRALVNSIIRDPVLRLKESALEARDFI